MEDFASAFIDASCTRAVACGQVPDKATCVAANALNDFDDFFASVRAGKTTYDGAAAAKCIATERAMGAALPCTVTALPDLQAPACLEIFKGTLANGAACSQGTQCLSAYCLVSSCGNGTPACCVGSCAPFTRVPIGGDCDPSASLCVDGSYCRVTTHLCAAEIAAGQPCDIGTGDYFCQRGLDCQTDPSSGARACRRRPAEGEACSGVCDALADFCEPSTMKCVPKIAAGGACSLSGGSCVDSARCDLASMTCVELGKAGEACDPQGPAPQCFLSLQCTAAGVCALPEPDPVCP
jgi:hypothetical protein